MKKIDTQRYGLKNLLEYTKIENSNNLFVGSISVVEEGMRFRQIGLLDDNFKEIIPFGELRSIKTKGIRVINDFIFVVDYEAYPGDYCCTDNWYGSLLYKKEYGEYKLKFISDAATIEANEKLAIGAYFDTEEKINSDDLLYPVKIFEYDFEKDKVNTIHISDIYYAVTGELQEYIGSKCHSDLPKSLVRNKFLKK